MSTRTLIQDRKQARLKKHEAQKQERIERAFKSAGIGVSTNPQKRLAVLEKYLEGLRALFEQTKQEFLPTEFGMSDYRLKEEIRRTIEDITRIRMHEIDPDYEDPDAGQNPGQGRTNGSGGVFGNSG